MRPSILFPIFAETRTLPGVGPKLEKLIGRVAGARLVDLAFDLPVGVIDRSYHPRLIEAEEGRIGTFTVNVLDHLPARDPRHPYRVRCSDDSAFLELVFFHARADYLANTLPVGSKRLVSGRIERFGSKVQMVHPDFVLAPENATDLPLHEPVYRLTDGLAGKSLAKAIRGALEKVPSMPEWQDAAFLKMRKWPPFA
jgi:ATP-dependent DNA helicase RecG